MEEQVNTEILVYMQDGRVFSYNVNGASKAREHAHRIITEGWRNNEEGVMCYYPVHQVLKVKFDMPDKDMLAGAYFAKPI
jgi:hypothetical protein